MIERRQKTAPTIDTNKKHILIILLILFVSYMIVEIVGAYFSSSLALLADAGHMAVDTSALILAIFATIISQFKPTKNKSYGYLRAEILGALINGIILFILSGVIFYKAIERLNNTPPIKGEIMTVVAFGGLIVNTIGLFLLHSSKEKNLNVKGVWLHILSDTLSSIFAFIGAMLIWFWGWNLIDPILSILLSFLIIFGAAKLLLDCVNVLLESTPKNIDLEKVQMDMKKIDGITDVHDLHIWALSSGVFCVTAHVGIGDEKEQQRILRDLISYFDINHGISHVTLQLEPSGFNHRKFDF